MSKKEEKICFLTRSNLWRVPLCAAAFSLLPSGYSYTWGTNSLLMPDASVESMQQQRPIKGIVVDENGEPVIGATVRLSGSSTGTITDMDGRFEINVAKGEELEISYIGYTTQTVKIGNSGSIQVTLREATEVLNEVVVTGFGMSQKKSNTDRSRIFCQIERHRTLGCRNRQWCFGR